MKKTFPAFVAAAVCPVLLLSCSACANNGGQEAGSVPETTTEPIAKVASAEETAPVATCKRVYFAGPLFNQAEKDFNLKLTQVLEEAGYEVFLPQRDGIEAALLEGKTEEEMIRMIFDLDSGEVQKADIIFMNLDGRVPDEGACVELGIAYAGGKRCYGFKTDTRSVELGMDLNPMISGCMTKIFKNYDGEKLIEEIRQYLSEHDL